MQTEQILRDQIAELTRLLELKNARIIELEALVAKTQIKASINLCKCQSTVCLCQK